MTFTTNNRVIGWIFDRVMGRKLTKISYNYERAYKDDDQIFESFAKQCIAEMRQQIDELEVELLTTKERET